MSGSIIIVDDSPVVRHALRSLIEETKEWKVCGEAENGKIAVERVKELHPDVVILDLQMPVMDGLQAAGQINHIAPNTIMLMFTLHKCEQLLKDAQSAGIRDVISKSDGLGEQLLAGLKTFHAESEDHASM